MPAAYAADRLDIQRLTSRGRHRVSASNAGIRDRTIRLLRLDKACTPRIPRPRLPKILTYERTGHDARVRAHVLPRGAFRCRRGRLVAKEPPAHNSRKSSPFARRIPRSFDGYALGGHAMRFPLHLEPHQTAPGFPHLQFEVRLQVRRFSPPRLPNLLTYGYRRIRRRI
jgi:hypothetical protein